MMRILPYILLRGQATKQLSTHSSKGEQTFNIEMLKEELPNIMQQLIASKLLCTPCSIVELMSILDIISVQLPYIWPLFMATKQLSIYSSIGVQIFNRAIMTELQPIISLNLVVTKR